jgi:heme-degrading monooxygenase HmoA
MVLEVAILDVRRGQGEAFEAAFREARGLIAAMPGHQRHELRRCLETPDRYLLLVWWDTLESHTEGFRKSPHYERWRTLLHPFYDPFPVVEHYAQVGLDPGGDLV